MKIIKPSAELIDPNEFPTIYQFIEKIGRTCYKSEEYMTETSATKFVENLVARKHWAMLEHAYIYLCIEERLARMLAAMDERDKKFLHISGDKMSVNLRAMYNFLFASSCPHNDVWQALTWTLQNLYPSVFGETDSQINMAFAPGSYILLSREDFIAMCVSEHDDATLRECLPHTVLFHVNRGVTHELVRHRPASFAQESTRYCNYSKGKFGTEITVVEPFWVEDFPDKRDALYTEWKDGCLHAEEAYMRMLNLGATAQEARACLPISVKSDIIVTATEAEWEHILNLRLYGTTGAPHPDMRKVMGMAAPLLREASNGRLYREDFLPAKPSLTPSNRHYIFVRMTLDGDESPLTWTDGTVLEFDGKDAADEFIKDARQTPCGLIGHWAYVDARPNAFLDTTKNHTNATGKFVRTTETGYKLFTKEQLQELPD